MLISMMKFIFVAGVSGCARVGHLDAVISWGDYEKSECTQSLKTYNWTKMSSIDDVPNINAWKRVSKEFGLSNEQFDT